MKVQWLIWSQMLVGCASVLGAALVLGEEPPTAEPTLSPAAAIVESDSNKVDDEGVTVEVARDRAKVMHDVYSATLDVMHDHYFHGDRATVPARALEDVFREIKRQTKAEARWISVNLRAMSVDHDPETEFEKRAAKEIAAGKTELEVIEDGYYRRAGAIPLTDGCVGCHGGLFRAQSKAAKFAGLVISVPVIDAEPKADKETATTVESK